MPAFLKSRWLRIALAVILLMVMPLAVYRYWWYSNTLRGRFHQVQIGMTKRQVKKILGDPGLYQFYRYDGEGFAETWYRKDQMIKYERVKRVATRDFLLAISNLPQPMHWEYDRVKISIWIDTQEKVSVKWWQSSASESKPFWNRVEKWLCF